MVNLRISWVTVKKVLKYIFSFLVILGVAYLGYLTYYFATNSPYKVRVTNVTGTSATISWYTNREDKGLVIYDQKNSFLPIISAFGKSKGYDDRDVALAQTTLMNKVTERSVKDVNADYEVSLDSQDLTDLKITKKGNYYVHHVTLNNLSPESKYYFRVGNGLFWWNVKVDTQKVQDFEAPTLTSLEFSTYKDPENLSAPNPAFGQVLSLARNKDGYLINNPSTDAIVFLKVDSDVDSQYQSSVVNTDGGWVIDKSNFRDSSGNIYKSLKEGDSMVAHSQFENVAPLESIQLLSGVTDNPAQYIYGNTDNEAKLLGNIIDKLKFSLSESNANIYANLISLVSAGTGETQADCPNEVWSPLKGCTGVLKTTPPAPTGGGSASLSPCIINGRNYGNMTTVDCRKKELALETDIPEPATSGGGTTCQKITCDDTSEWNQSKCACIKKQSANEYDKCEGQYPRTCDDAPLGGSTTNCYCRMTDGSGRYLPLRGIDCRPASCANNRAINNDNECYGGVCTPRTKCPATKPDCDEKEKVLCGSDYSTPGCGHATKCPQGTEIYTGNDTCVSTADMVDCNLKTGKTRMPKSLCDEKLKLEKESPPNDDLELDEDEDEDDKGQSTSNFVICVLPDGTKKRILKTTCDSLKGSADQNIPANQIYKDMTNDKACCSGSRYGPYVKTVTNSYNCGAGLYVCSPTCKNSTFVRNSLGVCVCEGSNKIYNPITETCDFVDKDNPVGIGDNRGCAQFNCGSYYGNICGKAEYKGNCAKDQYCEYTVSDAGGKRGLCKNKGVEMGIDISSDWALTDPDVKDDKKELKSLYTCCEYTGNAGISTSNYKLINNTTFGKDCKDILKDGWKDVDLSTCLEKYSSQEGSYVPDNNNNKVFAQTDNDLTTQGDYVIVFPESGVVNINVDDNQKNTYVNKNNKYFLYQNRDGVAGYQEPKNFNKPENDEDLVIKTTGRKIAVSKVAPMYKMKLNKGINIVSFNFLPTLDGKNGLKASEFIEIINNGTNLYIKSISYFDGGKWVGGVATNTTTYEVNGNDFTLVPGKGYAIVAFKDVSTEIPGLKVQEGIPVAFSSGWNLIGVNGYSTTYTASSLIDSLNGLSGIKANNVTWWPTSKGRYESFQKSEGVEYGFDYPILNDMGYFIRISEFNPESNSTKSIIWNPGNELNGTPGSEN